MLSGIRTGKKKKKSKKTNDEVVQERTSSSTGPPPAAAAASAVGGHENLSVAAKLKAALAAGGGSDAETVLAAARNTTPLDDLERRGRVQKAAGNSGGVDGGTIVVNAMRKNVNKREEDMTIHELATQERQSKHMSWDEEMTRNLARVGKRKRRKEGGNDDDSDQEVEKLQKLLPGDTAVGDVSTGNKRQQKSYEKSKQRDIQQQINQHQQQEKVTSKCSWWLESSSFSRHRLLALGDHVSLVMAPPSSSLEAGNHFYLVPLKHAKSFIDCDDSQQTWEEVHKFYSSLSKMYAKQGKGMVLIETVMPNRGFWQTKMECIPVSFSQLQDTPIYFKSAMTEQVETWGTHNRIMSATAQKPLRAVLPKNFPYFSVFWGSIASSPNTGYAQIIESTEFRHDFGIDTLAGMMELDPIRFQRKNKFSHEEERQNIATFLSKWKSVDWTIELDINK